LGEAFCSDSCFISLHLPLGAERSLLYCTHFFHACSLLLRSSLRFTPFFSF
jgi:hypothetical protein